MRVRFLPLAQQEIDDAFRWYEQQALGLGREFLDELDRVVRLVKTYPEISTEIDKDIRRFLLRFSLLAHLWPRR